MTAQSLMMMLGAGRAWQYGKRDISAKSNEEFNKYTPQDMIEETFADIREMIPTLKENMEDMKELQRFIITEMVSYIRTLPEDIVAGFSTKGQEGTTIDGIIGLLQSAVSLGNLGNQFTTQNMEQLAKEIGTQLNILPSAFAEEQNLDETTHPSYLKNVPLGQLQTRYLKEKNIKLKQHMFHEIQLRIQSDPEIFKTPSPVYEKLEPLVDTFAKKTPVTDTGTRKATLTEAIRVIMPRIRAQENNLKALKKQFALRLKTKVMSKLKIDNWKKAIRNTENIIKDLKQKLAGYRRLLKNF